MARKNWLMKSEPDVYSIDDLERDGTTCWDGVRNYQARNFMREEMKVGDLVLFYHSNARPPGVAGVARVSAEAYPDPGAWDRKSKYFDSKTKRDAPTWFMVDIEFQEKFRGVVSLDELRSNPQLEAMLVTRRGQRLSVQPVEAAHFRHVRKLGRARRAGAAVASPGASSGPSRPRSAFPVPPRGRADDFPASELSADVQDAAGDDRERLA